MMDAVHTFTGLVVFAQVFSLGVLYRSGSLRALLGARGLILRSLVSVLLVVPLCAVLLIALFPLPVEVATGIALLAACPGAPLTTRRAMPTGADLSFVSSLQLLLALLAMFFTPAVLFLLAGAFGLPLPLASPPQVAGQVGLVTFLPAGLGWLASRLSGRAAGWVRANVPRLAGGLWIGLIGAVALALILVAELRGSLMIGWGGAVAVVVLAAVALTAGWSLGFPRRDIRAGLAIATLARNIGLSLYVAESSSQSVAAIPTVLLFMIVGVVFGTAFSRFAKKGIQ